MTKVPLKAPVVPLTGNWFASASAPVGVVIVTATYVFDIPGAGVTLPETSIVFIPAGKRALLVCTFTVIEAALLVADTEQTRANKANERKTQTETVFEFTFKSKQSPAHKVKIRG